MDKYICSDITDREQILHILQDNADGQAMMGYTKALPSEEIERLKELLTAETIKLLELEDEKKDYIADMQAKIKEKKTAIKDASEKLKSKSEYVQENCFKFIDQKERRVGFYNHDGILVYERAAEGDELQGKLFPREISIGRTGTDNK